jgi:hypothetical protein
MMVARAAAPAPARAAAPRVTDVAAVTQVYAAARTAAPAVPAAPANQPTAPALPTFNSLFRDQDRSTAVDPGVAALWSTPADVPDARRASPSAPSAAAPSFDLFSDQPVSMRALFGNNS